MTNEEFIEKLYDAGWKSTCDAQHDKIKELLTTTAYLANEENERLSAENAILVKTLESYAGLPMGPTVAQVVLKETGHLEE